MDKQKLHELRVFAAEIRLETLKGIASRGFGHVGGSMSMADAMAVLYGEVMHIDPKNPRWEDRDWFVLSKGHGGPVMYATLGLKGYYPMESAYTLNQPNTNFPSHTDRSKTIGVDLTTGSLGQGMSEAIGAALGSRVQNRPSRVYVAVGDGECDEGQIWEGAQFAAHYKLDNLTVILDHNGLQIDGRNDEVMSIGDPMKKYEAFGFACVKVADGHDIGAIVAALNTPHEGKPLFVCCETHKGHGVSFMEDQVGWHGKAPSREEYEKALAELGVQDNG